MRYGRTEQILQLAQEMQASRIGLRLSDIKERFGVSLRTAQRMRDAVMRTFPNAEEQVDDNRNKRYRIPPRQLGDFSNFSVDEIADLEAAAKYLRRESLPSRAKSLQSIAAKIKGLLREQVLARMEPDLEALLEAEGLAMRPGPRPLIKPEIMDSIRLAVKAGRQIYVTYANRHSPRKSGRDVSPCGFLFGNRHYLVAFDVVRDEALPRLFALASIKKVTILEKSAITKPGFSLVKFAQRSFGVYQGQQFKVVWRFSKTVAQAAQEYVFHPTQEVEIQNDGSLLVSFCASGLLEMAWHVLTWGPEISVEGPAELIELVGKVRRGEQVYGPHEHGRAARSSGKSPLPIADHRWSGPRRDSVPE